MSSHKVLCWYTIIILLAILPRNDSCSRECVCSGAVKRCMCSFGGIRELYFGANQTTDDFTLEGCSEVIVHARGDTFRRMKRLAFHNIGILTIANSSLRNMEISDQFLLQNINELILNHDSFSGLPRIGNFELRSVKNNEVSDFGGLYNVGSVKISNCTFHKLNSLAFLASNVRSFVIEDSIIGKISRRSVVLTNVEHIVMNRSKIGVLEEQGFQASGNRNLEFQQCEFDLVASSAFVIQHVKTIAFKNCTFSGLRPKASEGLKAEESLTLSDNRIMESFFGNDNNNDITTFENNAFKCDCSIAWMWEEHQRSTEILSTSHCIHDNKVKLDSLSPVFDVYGNCSSLQVDDTKYNCASTPVAMALILLLQALLIYSF